MKADHLPSCDEDQQEAPSHENDLQLNMRRDLVSTTVRGTVPWSMTVRKGEMEVAPHRPTHRAGGYGERERNVTLRGATASGALCYGGNAAFTSLTQEGSILLGRLPPVLGHCFGGSLLQHRSLYLPDTGRIHPSGKTPPGAGFELDSEDSTGICQRPDPGAPSTPRPNTITQTFWVRIHRGRAEEPEFTQRLGSASPGIAELGLQASEI
ncbi:hypothetical protein D623_10024099 [Myotis brandtii]|uniref:Uncharacterized protein n=1 Tax=Myotis brandtii TaxID=109478 RepID=S7N992_MYOBR|nr:hypothetical protein D623_10024099 [Myotis brandtii]